MNDLAIVVIGYNRKNSMERLLQSLLVADYDNDKVDLIISIDNSGNNEVYNTANSFEWPFGLKYVHTYEKRMGLRKHVIKCGSYVENYDAIVVLEDDLLVAPGFYCYAKEAVNYYKNDNRIAGISLYTHLWNVNCSRSFQPEITKDDAYFLQFAQSWGQVWIKKQWNMFMEWYTQNQDYTFQEDKYPKFICSWPESSWLKYHIAYCVEKNKYFVYPYTALSTCCSEIGEHSADKSNLYQVPMNRDVKRNYLFSNLGSDAVCYDVYFERQGIGKYLGIDEKDLSINLYGEKKNVKCRYQITQDIIDKKVLMSYALEFRPHEINIINQSLGKDIFLYDMYQKGNSDGKKFNGIKQFLYYQRIPNEWKTLLKTCCYQVLDIVKSVIRGKL